MLGLPAQLATPPAQLGHGGVDLPQGAQLHLLQLFEKVGQHIGYGGRVIAGPVVVEGGQMQVLRHNVQLVFAQLRQQVLCQDQAVHRGIMKWNSILPAARGDKAHIKVGVVGRQRPVPGEGQKSLQRLLLGGSPLQHLIRDAGEVDDLRAQDAARGHKGVEAVGDLPVFQHHSTDLDDDLILLVQAGGLDVKADDLIRKKGVCLPVDHHPVIHVVDVIGLHAKEHLDLLGRVLGVWKGVGHAVVCDGDGPVSPGLRPLDHILVSADGGVRLEAHSCQGIHGGHIGVQMELHPLLRGVVHPGMLLRRHYGHRLQHHVAVEAVHVQPPLYQQAHPLFDPVHQGLALIPREKFIDPDGAGVVGEVKGNHPGPPLFQLPVVHGEYIALHHHHAHVQLQLPDGDRGPLDGFSVDGPALAPLLAAAFSLSGRGRGRSDLFQCGRPDGLRPGKGVLPRRRLSRPGLRLGLLLRRDRLHGFRTLRFLFICNAIQLYRV